jgi:hypothetical protein
MSAIRELTKGWPPAVWGNWGGGPFMPEFADAVVSSVRQSIDGVLLEVRSSNGTHTTTLPADDGDMAARILAALKNAEGQSLDSIADLEVS